MVTINNNLSAYEIIHKLTQLILGTDI